MALVRTANPGEYRYDGATIRAQGFNKHPVVHACIRAVADIVASVPLVVLQERGNYESRVGANHPLQKLLDYPGPRFTSRQFRAKFAVDFLGYGNSFFQLERTAPSALPYGIRAVNAESMQQVWVDAEGDPRRYDYANWAGIIVQVPTEDLLHFRDLDMSQPNTPEVFGYPRGATAIGSILADNEATQYVRQVVTNDGTPTFAVLMSDEATSDDASAMQDRYRARVVDRGKRGTPAFFGAVKDIKPLGFTLSDLEFPDLRRVSREDICAAFGVDPRMIGIGSATNDAGLSGVQYVEARARLVQHTIEPMFAALEDELNHWLAPEYGNVWVSYDQDVLRDLVEDDTATSLRIRAEFVDGLRTWEESRVALKLSPLPEPTDSILKTAGRDLIPAAVAVIDPTAIADVPAEAPAPAPEAEMEDEEPEDENEDEMEGEDEEPEEVTGVSEADRSEPEAKVVDVRRLIWERANNELDRTEQTYKVTAEALFRAERGKITKSISRADGFAGARRAVRNAYRADSPIRENWQDSFTPLVSKTYAFGATEVAGVGASLAADAQEAGLIKRSQATVEAAIRRRTAKLAERIGDTTADEVMAAISAAERAGMTLTETARLVGAAVYGEERIDARATMIARTESAGALSQGSWDQAQEMGDLYRSKEWLSFGDARETHQACMAEGPIPIDRAFSNGLMYPLDESGDAAEVINCRCVLAYSDEPA